MKSLLTNIGFAVGGTLVIVLALFGASLILALPIMWLWNWVMVDLFHFPEIGYLKALGLNLLFGMLFNRMDINSKKD